MKTYRIAFASLASMATLAFVVGCAQEAAPPDADPATPDAPATGEAEDGGGHSHGDAPHGGTLADWGGGAYHVEFTVDHDKQEGAVYLLGDDAQTPAPVKTDKLLLSIDDPKFQVELMPVPLEGETGGMSSRFVGQHESLGIVQEFSGTISGEVEGTPYAGTFEEQPHGAHGHDHE